MLKDICKRCCEREAVSQGFGQERKGKPVPWMQGDDRDWDKRQQVQCPHRDGRMMLHEAMKGCLHRKLHEVSDAGVMVVFDERSMNYRMRK